jgi:hypothetical protein
MAPQGSIAGGQPSSPQQPPQKAVGPSADSVQPYRPVGRDPFKKAVIRPSSTGKKAATPKAIGFPPLEARRAKFQQDVIRARQMGLTEPEPLTQYLVNEVEVLGFFRDDQGSGAFVRAQPTGTTFFVRRGAKCHNGEILRIESDDAESAGNRVMFREESYTEVGNKQVKQERVVAKLITTTAATRR